MFIPNQKTAFLIDLPELEKLCSEHLDDLSLDMSVFTRGGNHHYFVEVTNEIIEYDLWKTEKYGLLDCPERRSVSEALADYLSIIAWRNGIPAGNYIVSVFW